MAFPPAADRAGTLPSAALIRIFVSSPGDVAAERNVVEDVADRINRIDGRRRGFRLDVKRWEKDTFPALGDIQKNVTRMLGEYEIFVGIMWNRFGTPTDRAESGTEEEFNLALDAWRQDNTRPVMMYFRDTPVRTTELSDENWEQMAKVRQFKQRVASQILRGHYTDPTDFERKLHDDLRKAIDDYLNAHPNQGRSTTASDAPVLRGFSVYLGSAGDDGTNQTIRSQLESRLHEDDLNVHVIGDTELALSAPDTPLVSVHFISSPSTEAQRSELTLATQHARWLVLRSSTYPADSDPFAVQLRSLDRSRAEFFPVALRDATKLIVDKIACWQRDWQREVNPPTRLYLDVPPRDVNNKTVEEFLNWLDRFGVKYVLRNYSSSPTFDDFLATIPKSKAAVFVFASSSQAAVQSRIEKAWGIASFGQYNLDLWGVFLASPAELTVLKLQFVPDGRLKYMDNIARFDEDSVRCILDTMGVEVGR